MPDPTLLALGSALCYGFVDFAGGLLARRAEFAAVAFAGQVGGFLFMLGAVLLFTTADPSMALGAGVRRDRAGGRRADGRFALRRG
ncbi:hypothetical protein [Amycolatopsis keratiniphila]|uniref:Uncharacterized protein n=1 Tax=Amycolatopsis keratiniphila subsp. keratiniphila TaxID=227715 RepID=A0A1W2LYV3_9PSEU|nr:hypothetical protein [Amycolatopsis keratiniphila]ONF72362.1 hypothetical protein AVR91_0209095 [Amycolatopsis keratiniphila subsp. keratiniphila]